MIKKIKTWEKVKSLQRLKDKYREIISYIFWGMMTTIVNYLTYFICTKVLNWSYILGNAIAWVISVIFAFTVNKIFVFQSKKREYKIVLHEFKEFVFARIFSGILETIILIIFVDVLYFDNAIVKIITGFVIVIINYIFSKFLIFKDIYQNK